MKKIIFTFILFSLFFCVSNVSANYIDNTISIDDNDFYAIKTDNSLWVWRDGSTTSEPEKLLDDTISINKGYAFRTNGTLWNCHKKAVQFSERVKNLSAGPSYVLFTKYDNTLWYNDFSNNDGPIKLMNNVQNAQVGFEHCVILKTDGSAWTIGDNSYGQLGIGNDIKYSIKPTKILENVKDIFAGESSSFAVSDNNILWMCGTVFGNHTCDDNLDQYIPIEFIENAKEISVHYRHALVLKTDNTLWQYSFANSSNSYESVAIKIADDINCMSEWTSDPLCTTLVLKNNGELYTYNLDVGGYNFNKIAEDIRLPKEKNDIEPNKDFIDISNKSEEMQKAINSLSKAKIIEGTTDTEFSPDKTITRAEIAALLLRMTGKTEKRGNNDFIDVTPDKWYYHIAEASKSYKLVLGFEDNTFRGDDAVSKVQLVSLVSRVLKNERNIDTKADVNMPFNIPDWAKADVALASQEELISAEKDLTNPDEPMLRGEAAVILYRLYNKI